MSLVAEVAWPDVHELAAHVVRHGLWKDVGLISGQFAVEVESLGFKFSRFGA